MIYIKNEKARGFLKITLVPNTRSFYDKQQLRNFAAAFRAMGCEAITYDNPIKKLPNEPNDDLQGIEQTRIEYKKIKTDILLEVNRYRDKNLKKGIRHICWFQDLKPSEIKPLLQYGEKKDQKDLIYLLGSKEHFGLSNTKIQMGSLLSGLTEEECRFNESKVICRDIDVNLLGYLPPFHKKKQKTKRRTSQKQILFREIIRRPKLLLEILWQENWHINLEDFEKTKFYVDTLEHIEKNYKPLSGSMISWHEIQPTNKIDFLIYDLLYAEKPRWIDRMAIFHACRALFENGKKVLIAGKNWGSTFPECEFIQNHNENPLDIFRKSAITLHNNTHGIGIHSRVLEAMAAGSFVMMHSSPHSQLAGGIDSSFEPDLHYGLYSENNLAEKVEYWLTHKSRRQNAIKECFSVLRGRHTWRHRARQILGDLA